MLKDNIENLATDKFADCEVARKNIPINKKQIIKMNIKYNTDNINKKLCKKFKLIKNDQEIIFKLKGQKAKTLKCLIESKSKGCTALDISRTFALRLSEYIRALRHDNLAGGFNLDIVMIREKNPTNWHGRYILNSKVELVEIFG
ncbi:hypothetical protein N9O56_01830 [Rickettsiales bacterium]|nr:hypothetical protein [Rickettsiales bacterium]